MALVLAMEGLEWMNNFMAPWNTETCIIFKYQHVGTRRTSEWLVLEIEDTDRIDLTNVKSGNKIPVCQLRGSIGFFRLTKRKKERRFGRQGTWELTWSPFDAATLVLTHFACEPGCKLWNLTFIQQPNDQWISVHYPGNIVRMLDCHHWPVVDIADGSPHVAPDSEHSESVLAFSDDAFVNPWNGKPLVDPQVLALDKVGRRWSVVGVSGSRGQHVPGSKAIAEACSLSGDTSAAAAGSSSSGAVMETQTENVNGRSTEAADGKDEKASSDASSASSKDDEQSWQVFSFSESSPSLEFY